MFQILLFFLSASALYNSTDVIWAAILDWKDADGILRIQQVKKENPSINLLSHSPFEKVISKYSFLNFISN
jgi:hypothetical protein